MNLRSTAVVVASSVLLWSPVLAVFRWLGLSWPAAGLAAATAALWSAVIGQALAAVLRRLPARVALNVRDQECRLCHDTGGVVIRCSTCEHVGRGRCPLCSPKPGGLSFEPDEPASRSDAVN